MRDKKKVIKKEKMCSKMSSGSYGDDYSGLCPEKHKPDGRRKVPRRGPRVAELEKIRLKEQHNSTALPLTTTIKTSPVYPISSYLTTGYLPYDLIPPALVFHRKHDPSLHYLPPMNPPNPGSEEFNHFIEPPSNQTFCLHNLSQILDEKKPISQIVAAKIPWNFIAESTNCSVGPTTTLSRDGTQTRLDLRFKNHFQDSRNSNTFDSPTPITPNSPFGFPHFIQYEEQQEEFDHEIMTRRSVANISLNKKPLYYFLSSNDQDSSFSLKTHRYDALTDHTPDLRLKL